MQAEVGANPRWGGWQVWWALALWCLLLATSEAAAAMAPWPADALALRQRIEALGERQRPLTVELARQALSEALSPAQQAWFLDRLTKDLFRLRRWADCLAAARQGMALAGNSPQQQVRFATWAGYALLAQGQQPEVRRLDDEHIAPFLPGLLASPDPQARRRAVDAMRLRAALLQVTPGQAGQAMEQLTQVLRLYEGLQDAEGRAETLHMIAALRFAGGDVDQAVRAQHLAIEVAQQGQVDGVLARLYALLAYLQAQAGDKEAYQQALQASLRNALQEGDEYYQAMVHFNRSDDAYRRRDWDQAIELSEWARRIFEKMGDASMAASCRINHGVALNRAGRPGGAGHDPGRSGHARGSTGPGTQRGPSPAGTGAGVGLCAPVRAGLCGAS